jgi:hypothetical protein
VREPEGNGVAERFIRTLKENLLMEWSGRAPALQRGMLGRGTIKRSTAMSNKSNATIATMGIDIGKNSFCVVGLDQRGAIVLRQKWSRGQVEARLANMPPCLIRMEACVGAHHLSRKLQSLGHDARLMPARYVRAYLKGQKNDFRELRRDRATSDHSPA